MKVHPTIPVFNLLLLGATIALATTLGTTHQWSLDQPVLQTEPGNACVRCSTNVLAKEITVAVIVVTLFLFPSNLDR